MDLQLIRTYTKIGLVGQLYHRSYLVLYWVERNPCKGFHSCLFELPPGDYLLEPSIAHLPEWILTGISPGDKKKTAIFTQAAEITLIYGCEDPLCIITPEGETQLTRAAIDNLKFIFYPRPGKELSLSLSIKDTIEHQLNKTSL